MHETRLGQTSSPARLCNPDGRTPRADYEAATNERALVVRADSRPAQEPRRAGVASTAQRSLGLRD